MELFGEPADSEVRANESFHVSTSLMMVEEQSSRWNGNGKNSVDEHDGGDAPISSSEIKSSNATIPVNTVEKSAGDVYDDYNDTKPIPAILARFIHRLYHHSQVGNYSQIPMDGVEDSDDDDSSRDKELAIETSQPSTHLFNGNNKPLHRQTTATTITATSEQYSPYDYREEDQLWTNQATCAGLLGGSMGAAVGGVCLSFVCAVGCMVIAKEDTGRVGNLARQSGDCALSMVTRPYHCIMERGKRQEQHETDGMSTTDEFHYCEKETTKRSRKGMSTDSAGTVWLNVLPTQSPLTLEQSILPMPLAQALEPSTQNSSRVDFVKDLRWCVPCHTIENDKVKRSASFTSTATCTSDEHSTNSESSLVPC